MIFLENEIFKTQSLSGLEAMIKSMIKCYNQLFMTRYLLLKIAFTKVKAKSQSTWHVMNTDYLNVIKFMQIKSKYRTGRQHRKCLKTKD